LIIYSFAGDVDNNIYGPQLPQLLKVNHTQRHTHTHTHIRYLHLYI